MNKKRDPNALISISGNIVDELNRIFEFLNWDHSASSNDLIYNFDPNKGDFSFPCFELAKKIKIDHNGVATLIKKNFKKNEQIRNIEAINGYLNFYIDKNKIVPSILKQIIRQKGLYGNSNIGKNRKTMIEFSSPNTNKPLHLGHLRNIVIGSSVSNILEATGFKVIRATLLNDRGIHICKSMLAYKEFGENKDPNKKPDHFVGDYYIKFNELAKENDNYNKEAQEMLLQWENGDEEIRFLWKKMNAWAYQGLKQTFELFGVKHDKYYYESEIFNHAKELVLEGLKSGLFKKRDDGAVVMDLTEDGLDEKVLLRPDGTTVYMTQDLYLMKLKDADYSPDNSIYIVGNEQDYHFKVLFLILKKMGWKQQLKHLSYGIVALPEGRMKSREGNVVNADDLIETVTQLAKKESVNRNKNINGEDGMNLTTRREYKNNKREGGIE